MEFSMKTMSIMPLELTSYGTPKLFKTTAASFIVGRSESDPMIIPTRGVTVPNKHI